MKNILFILAILFSFAVYSQPPPPNGGGPSCWPPSPACNPGAAVPINNELIILVVLALSLGIWYQYRNNTGYPIT